MRLTRLRSRATAVMAGLAATLATVGVTAAADAASGPHPAAVSVTSVADTVPGPAGKDRQADARRLTSQRSPRLADADDGTVNTDYSIVNTAVTTSRVWYKTVPTPPFRLTDMGVAVIWQIPSDRAAYDKHKNDWVGIYEGNGTKGTRVYWDWTCPSSDYKEQCGEAFGATVIATGKLTHGKEYTAAYYSDGGASSNGTLRATYTFWA